MTAMLRILSIVALVAVAQANIADYSKAAVQEIFAPGSALTSAQLINADVEITFSKINSGSDDSIALLAGESTAPAKEDEKCGNNLGIVLNGETNCILSALTLKQIGKSGKQGLQLELAFKLNQKPVVVAVPILKVPSEGTSSSKKWAADNNVVLAPAEIEKLSDLKEKQTVKIGFKWFSDLLAQGVNECTDESATVTVSKLTVDVQPYITKAVVVSGDIAQKMAAIVQNK